MLACNVPLHQCGSPARPSFVRLGGLSSVDVTRVMYMLITALTHK